MPKPIDILMTIAKNGKLTKQERAYLASQLGGDTSWRKTHMRSATDYQFNEFKTQIYLKLSNSFVKSLRRLHKEEKCQEKLGRLVTEDALLMADARIVAYIFGVEIEELSTKHGRVANNGENN